MRTNPAFATALIFVSTLSCMAQDEPRSEPAELEVLKGSIGVWDAEFRVWPQGPDSDPITFKGVETNRAYGKHWVASDLDSEFMGQTMRIHSIVGYDLDKKQLVGTIIDHGPYSASMTGDYDKESKTVHWKTEAKDLDGKPMVQRTRMTQKSADERVLVLLVPGEKDDEFIKMMEIKFVRRN